MGKYRKPSNPTTGAGTTSKTNPAASTTTPDKELEEKVKKMTEEAVKGWEKPLDEWKAKQEAKVAEMKTSLDEVKTSVTGLTDDLKVVKESLEELKGGKNSIPDSAARSLYGRLNGEPNEFKEVYAVRMHGNELSWRGMVPGGTVLEDADGCAWVVAADENAALEIALYLEPKHDHTAMRRHVWSLDGTNTEFAKPFAVATFLFE